MQKHAHTHAGGTQPGSKQRLFAFIGGGVYLFSLLSRAFSNGCFLVFLSSCFTWIWICTCILSSTSLPTTKLLVLRVPPSIDNVLSALSGGLHRSEFGLRSRPSALPTAYHLYSSSPPFSTFPPPLPSDTRPDPVLCLRERLASPVRDHSQALAAQYLCAASAPLVARKLWRAVLVSADPAVLALLSPCCRASSM